MDEHDPNNPLRPPSDAELSGDGALTAQPRCVVCRERTAITIAGTCFYKVCQALMALRERITTGKLCEWDGGLHHAQRQEIGGEWAINRPCIAPGIDPDGLEGMARA